MSVKISFMYFAKGVNSDIINSSKFEEFQLVCNILLFSISSVSFSISKKSSLAKIWGAAALSLVSTGLYQNDYLQYLTKIAWEIFFS